MVRERRVNNRDWPSWRYGPNGESAIFQCADDVPLGWTKKPGDIYEPPEQSPVYDRAELITELQSRGVLVRGEWSSAYMKDLLDNGSSSDR